MSYCVNCGVELDSSLKKCPLCNTPVVNPNQLKATSVSSPFPERTGHIEPVTHKDLTILVTVILLAVSLTCGLLNAFLYRSIDWSIPVIGMCLFLWICFLPITLLPNIPIYVTYLCDSIALGIYLYLISFLTPTRGWFLYVALPILGVALITLELFTILAHKLPFFLLVGILYVTTFAACICLCIEISLDLYLHDSIMLSWSAIVLAICVIIIISLITILSSRRIRNMVQRRLHF